MVQKERYGYAVARLKALENKLLDETFLLRMLDCDTLEAALRVLGETPYSPWIMELKSPFDFDKAIEKELARCYREVSSFTPDQELVSLCRLVYDVHNVKVLIKGIILASRGGKRRLDLLTSLGNIEKDRLTAAIEGEDYWDLPFGLATAIPQAMASWNQSQNLLSVEKILDSVYFKAMLDLCGNLGLERVKAWVQVRIDGENLKTALRLTKLSVERGSEESFLHAGGEIATKRLAQMVTEPVETWARLLAFTNIGSLLTRFQDGGDFNASLVQFEKDLDNYVTSAVSKNRYAFLEPVNIVRYLWLREIEARNLRIILVSISNGVGKETIRGLLRNVE